MSDLQKRLRQLSKEMTEGDPQTAAMLVLAAKALEALPPEGREWEQRYWVSVEDAMPQPREIVLVSGGTAMFFDGAWYTGMEEPLFRRAIEWKVTHWRPIPLLRHRPQAQRGNE